MDQNHGALTLDEVHALIVRHGGVEGVRIFLHLKEGELSETKETSLSIPRNVEATERSLIEAALRRSKGNRMNAAELLQISFRNLQYKIKRYGIYCEGWAGSH